jgi:hypothetical protein
METLVLQRNKSLEEAQKEVEIGTSVKVESILRGKQVEVIVPILRGG